jgi:hypothetical protein
MKRTRRRRRWRRWRRRKKKIGTTHWRTFSLWSRHPMSAGLKHGCSCTPHLVYYSDFKSNLEKAEVDDDPRRHYCCYAVPRDTVDWDWKKDLSVDKKDKEFTKIPGISAN